MTVYYAGGFLLIYFFFLVAEFFIPSAGLLAVAAVVTALSTIIIAFTHSGQMGVIFTAIITASTPIILYYMIRLWPHTPLGRRILNRKPGDQFDHSQRTMRDGTPISNLIGKMGVAQTDLLPSGMVLIADQKIDAVSTGMPIDKGSHVVVLRTTSGKIQVRAARENEINVPTDAEPQASHAIDGAHDAASSGPLDGPLESLDLDSLDGE